MKVPLKGAFGAVCLTVFPSSHSWLNQPPPGRPLAAGESRRTLDTPQLIVIVLEISIQLGVSSRKLNLIPF